MTRPQRHTGWGYWGLWVLVGLYFAALDSAGIEAGSRHIARVVFVDLVQHLFWGVLVLGLLHLLDRYPLGAMRDWRPWAVYLGLSLALTSVGLLFVWQVVSFMGGPLTPVGGTGYWGQFWSWHWRYFHAAWANFVVAIGAWYAWDLHRRYREREMEKSRLEAELAKAQHQALRMQLQPHFLFNALNTINSLVRVDPDAAERMVSRLGEFLRHTLEQNDAQEVSLRTELEVLECYLEIQRIRFGPRLKTSLACPEDLLHAMVPNLLLQPLVENAFKHGLGKKGRECHLDLRIRREGDLLWLEVEDNGKGLGPAPIRDGVGTGNTRSRLARLYGERQGFELLPAPSGGALARVRLPLHWRPVEEEDDAWFEQDELAPALTPRTNP